MSSIVSAFAPIWLIVFVGWATCRLKVVDPDARDVLTGFSFNVAMPALLFTTLAKISVRQVDGGALGTFAVSTVAVGLLAVAGSRRVTQEGLSDQVIGALAASYVNSGNLGIPIATGVLGDLSTLVLVIAFQLLIVTPLALSAIGAGAGDRIGWQGLLLAPLKNPITVASAAGLAVAASGLHPPAGALRPLQVLGQSAVPIALFALGMSLRRPGEALGLRRCARLGSAVMLKIVIQPLAAYVVGRFVFHLDQRTLAAVVLFAGLPTAQNIFVYAVQYGRPTDLVRDVILITSLLSMASLFLITALVPPR